MQCCKLIFYIPERPCVIVSTLVKFGVILNKYCILFKTVFLIWLFDLCVKQQYIKKRLLCDKNITFFKL